MRRNIQKSQAVIAVSVLVALLALCLPGTSRVDAADAPSLVISQVKITSSNGQFVTLYNTTDSELDMSKYQLEYFNSYDLTKATSSRLISLVGMVPPHGYYMVNDDSLLMCYQLTVNSTSLGFSSTAGMVEVLGFEQNSPGSSANPELQDYVSWSKTAANGAQTLPASSSAFLRRQPADDHDNPSVNESGGGSWQSVQPDPANPCNLITTTSSPTNVPTGLNLLLPAAEPAATIISTGSSGQAAPALPASDIGLMAPSVTELLPNPNGTGNDSTNEFIELYNPNARSFDLSGFTLQTGLSKSHNFVLPAGTSLPPHSFTAFYSRKTGLTLSNSGSQARLLDPFGNNINTSGTYGTARDGQAWALAEGKWYWTSQPTPGKANVIKQPATAKKSSTKKASSKVKKGGAMTTAHLSSTSSADNASGVSPVRPWVLATVGGLALLYGAYEYRSDLANRMHELRRNLASRRNGRAESARR